MAGCAREAEERGLASAGPVPCVNDYIPPQAVACTYRIALEPRTGQKVLTLQIPSQEAPPTEQRCVNAEGFSLHADALITPEQRQTSCLLGYVCMRRP